MVTTDMFRLPANFRDRIREVLDPSTVGGVEIPGLLTEDYRRLLLEEERRFIQEDIRKYGYDIVRECGWSENVEDNASSLPYLLSFMRVYERAFKRGANSLGLVKDDIGVNNLIYYPVGARLRPHRDGYDKRARYPRSIITLEGRDPFLVAREEGEVGIPLGAEPGSLVLLRIGPGTSPSGVPPLHWRDPVTAELYGFFLTY